MSVPLSILYLSNIDFRFRLLIAAAAVAGAGCKFLGADVDRSSRARERCDNVSANLRPYNFLPIVKLSYRTAILPKPSDFSCNPAALTVFQTVRAGGTTKRRNVNGSLGMQGEYKCATGIPYGLSDPACIRSRGVVHEMSSKKRQFEK